MYFLMVLYCFICPLIGDHREKKMNGEIRQKKKKKKNMQKQYLIQGFDQPISNCNTLLRSSFLVINVFVDIIMRPCG